MKEQMFSSMEFIWKCRNLNEFVKNIKEKRRTGKLPLQMNVRDYSDFRIVLISTEPGRVLRPLIVCDNGIPRLTDEHMVQIRTRMN